MKKYLLSLAVICFAFSLSAQNKPAHMQKDSEQFKVAVKNHKPAVGHEQTVYKQEPANAKPTAGNFQKNFQEVVIGHSYYDTQTNGCIQKRVIRGSDYIEAAWTMAQEPTFADRGTGYVKYENTLWGPEPLERLESERVGWPTLLETGGGRILSLAHSNAPYHITMTHRDAGETAWTESSVPTDLETGVLWGHGCVGGADNNTIHLLALSTPIAFDGGALVDGQNGTIRYYRSADQGDTWEVQDFLIPGMGIDDYLSMGPDQYDIVSTGDRVVIGLFHDWADSKVFISEDGGDTWNSTVLRDFPVDLHPVDVEILDVDGDLLPDTAFSTDSAGQVFLDEAGQAHAAYGDMFYLDDAVGAADGWSYFPGTQGLNYWNETFGPDSSTYVGYLIDLDDSGTIDFTDDIAAYGTSSTSHPTFGEDAMGNLYITYSGVVESHATGTQNYRHLYAVKSENGGMDWTEPKDLTPDLDYIGLEYAFPVLADVVDDQLHIICQRDGEPGTALTDSDPTAENEWIYFGVTTDLDIDNQVSIDKVKTSPISIYPVPARDLAYVNLGGLGAVNLDIYNMVGGLVLSQFETNNIVTLDVSELATGVYTLAVTKDGQRFTSKLIVE
jgi:hypothetical protein